jgi:hypothetical protein
MIGCVLAAMKENDVVVFTTSESSGWLEFYAVQFPNATIRHVSEYDPREWDTTILLTDDDFTMGVGAIPDEKMLCIEHFHVERRPGSRNLRRVGTRRFANRPDLRWFIPTYSIHGIDQKLNRRRITDKTVVTCVGVTSDFIIPPRTFTDIVWRRFSNAKDIRFHVFRPHATSSLVGKNDGRILLDLVDHVNAPASDLVEHLLHSDYVMLLTGHLKEEGHCRHAISGAIPLAFATGCRLIVTSEVKREYALDSPLVVEADSYFNLRRPTVSEIRSVYDETERLIDQRDRNLSLT